MSETNKIIGTLELHDGIIWTNGGVKRKITTINSNYIVTKFDYCIEIEGNNIEVELLPPISDNNGQEFEIDVFSGTGTILTAYSKTFVQVNSITNTTGNTYRFNVDSGADLSNYTTGNKIKITNATNAGNNGYFDITAVDNTNHWVEITNVNGVVEGGSSQIQLRILNDTSLTSGMIHKYRAYANRDTYKKIS